MDEIKKLLEKRATLVNEARDLLNKADAEKRVMGAEENEQWTRIMNEADVLGEKVKQLERQLKIEEELKGSFNKPNLPDVGQESQESREPTDTREYTDAFWKQFRKNRNSLVAEEMRALNVGTDAAGGFLVPDSFETKLINGLEEENVMRGLATVIRTKGDHKIPVVSAHGEAFWTGEQAPSTESDEVFAQKMLTAHKITVLMKVTEELLHDSYFNLEQYIRNEYVRRIGVKEEAAFIDGDGVGKPLGVTTGGELGVTAAATAAIVTDELISLYHSLKRPYRARARWLIGDNTVMAIRKLKETGGQYLWQPGLQAGQPDRLLGRPVVVSDLVPAMTTGNKSVILGDFSYYWVADRKGRVFQRLGEIYAVTGQVGFRARQKVDGMLVLAEAVKYLQQA